MTSSPAIKWLGGALKFQETPWTGEITTFLWLTSEIVIISL